MGDNFRHVQLYYQSKTTVTAQFFARSKVGVHRVVESLAHAPRASPLALVAVRRRSSIFLRRLFSGAPRLTAVRRATGLIMAASPMYRRPVSFGAFPVYQVVLWAVAVGGAAQVISGAARLGSADGSAARLGGSALLRRLGSSAGLFFFSSSLVASSSSLSRVVTSSARTRTRRGAASRAGRLRSRP